MKTTAYYYIDNSIDSYHIDTNGNTHTEAVIDMIDFWNFTPEDKVVEEFEVYSQEEDDWEITTVIKGEIAAHDEDGEFTEKTNEITIVVCTDKDE